jgi:hypothetical protein
MALVEPVKLVLLFPGIVFGDDDVVDSKEEIIEETRNRATRVIIYQKEMEKNMRIKIYNHGWNAQQKSIQGQTGHSGNAMLVAGAFTISYAKCQ